MANYYRSKKVSYVTDNPSQDIDYKDVELLKMYVMESGRIIPARLTGTSAIKQRQVAKAVKLARFIALLPYTDQHQY